MIETDSQYAINCSTTWVHGWKKNGWKNSQKKPVKNADLIRAIDTEISKRPGSVKFVWVKGHAGNAGNEKVDELARTYAGDCRSKVREGYLPLEGWQSLLASEYAQGIDVPDDAQMLLDGKITSDEYHIGRGQGESAGGSLADDLIGVSDPEPRPRSIADMLVARRLPHSRRGDVAAASQRNAGRIRRNAGTDHSACHGGIRLHAIGYRDV